MRRTRVERKVRATREDRNPTLPLDPRDPDVAKAKQRVGRLALRSRLTD